MHTLNGSIPTTQFRPAASSYLLLEKLTPSEKAVLNALAAGQVPSKIAEALGTKISTVRTHIRSLNGKLDAHSVVELLFKARTYGLIV